MSSVGRLSKGKRSVGEVGKKEKAAARKSVTRTTLINPQGISWSEYFHLFLHMDSFQKLDSA